MRLELPSAKHIASMAKYGFFLAVPFLAIAWWIVQKDPNLPRVEQYLTTRPEIVAKIGPIKTLSLTEATHVQDAVGYDGNETPGYNLYRYAISGESGKLLVTVRWDKSSIDQPDTFSITEVNAY